MGADHRGVGSGAVVQNRVVRSDSRRSLATLVPRNVFLNLYQFKVSRMKVASLPNVSPEECGDLIDATCHSIEIVWVHVLKLSILVVLILILNREVLFSQ